MTDPVHSRPNRRQFVLGGAVAAAAIGTAAAQASAETLKVAAGASVVLHDPRIPIDAAVAARLVANGARVIALDADPVRMWRSEIGEVLADPSTRLMGVTHWADLLIVRGLAAESRRHVRHEKLDVATGTFIWLIA